MTKDRITFLYFLFEKVDISDIAESRVANNEFDTTQIIGKFPTERKRILSVVYNKFLNKLPLEIVEKKKSNFYMSKG